MLKQHRAFVLPDFTALQNSSESWTQVLKIHNAFIVIVTNKKGLKKYDLLNLLTTCKSKEVAGAGEEESKLGI